jgi:hypothetical protein
VIVVVAVTSVVAVMILMVPVAFVQLPTLPVVVIMGMAPIGSFIRRTVPAAGNPSIVTAIWSPITVHPSVTRAWSGSALLVTKRRRCATYVDSYLCRRRDGESGCDQ